MVRLLFFKMLRDLKSSAGTYLVCVAIIATGFTGYCVLSIMSDQLAQSRDSFYALTSFADGFAEVHEAPLSALRSLERIEGVSRVQGRIVKTVPVAGYGDNAPELKLMAYTESGLNLPYLSRGILPQKGEESLILGDGFFAARELALGEVIHLTIGGREVPLTIAGSGLSPENIYMVKSMVDMLPNAAQYDAAFLHQETMEQLFSMEGRCNDIVFTLLPGYEMSDVEEEIRSVLKPYGCYRVYDRSQQLSVSVFDMEIDQIGRMAGAIPFLFLFISAVILYISLGRMIERQRVQIGTLMALGLSSGAIAAHYTLYGALIGFVGGAAGGVLGNLCAGPMADYFRSYFSMPETPIKLSLSYVIIGAVMASVFCSMVSALPAYASGKLEPAEAMRPAPPKTAKKSWLEKIPFLMGLFTVSGVLAVRGITRNRVKSLLSLFGIACAYMITTTLVSMSALFDIYIFDYLEKTQQQDITVSFSAPIARGDALRAVGDPSLQHAEGVLEVPATIRGVSDELDCVIQGIETDSVLCRLYDEEDHLITVDESGIVLSTHMAGLLGAGAGDYIEVEVSYPERRISRVPVSRIMAQYLGSTAYMSLEGLGRISDYQNAITSVLIQGPQELRETYMDDLSGAEHVAGVKSRWEVIDQYRGMMGSVTGIMFAMACMGILIGVAVIYVSSVISYEELKREISTMMMLGLNSRQCLEVITVGQWMLTLGSFCIGIPMTYGVSFLLTRVIAGEMFSIPPFISSGSLLMGAGLTCLCVLMSSVIMHRKLKKMQPVDLMRERE